MANSIEKNENVGNIEDDFCWEDDLPIQGKPDIFHQPFGYIDTSRKIYKNNDRPEGIITRYSGPKHDTKVE